MLPLAEKHLTELIPYVPGKPIEETEREYGVTNIAKLASNENCLGPSPKAIEAVQQALKQMHLYPDADCYYLKQKLCERHQDHGIGTEHLVVGNGTNELLTLMVRAFVGEGEAVCFPWPSFVVYKLAAKGCGRAEITAPLNDDLTYNLEALAEAMAGSDAKAKLVFLANPNNPIGAYAGQAAIDAFLGKIDDDVIVVLDEAYAEYVSAEDYPDGIALVKARPRTVVTRTFSKIFGLAACRVGYAVCDPAIVDILNRLRDPFNVNLLGQKAAIAALDDTDHIERARAHNLEQIPVLTRGLEELGVQVTPSQANFVLATFDEGGVGVAELNERLLKQAIIIRPVKGYGLPRSARITVGTAEENQRLLATLKTALEA
jgi:histidinol-phosphate aminotransferase